MNNKIQERFNTLLSHKAGANETVPTLTPALARQLLHVPLPDPQESTPGEESQNPERPIFVCPHCGHAMTIVLTLARGETIRAPPLQATP